MLKRACWVASSASLAATLLAGCGDCIDCNQCVPATKDLAAHFVPGADPDGKTVVQFSIQEEGTCQWEQGPEYWLRYDAGALSVTEPTGTFDSSMVEYDGDQYSYTDRDLVVIVDYTVEPAMITFVENGSSTNAECDPGDPLPTCDYPDL